MDLSATGLQFCVHMYAPCSFVENYLILMPFGVQCSVVPEACPVPSMAAHVCIILYVFLVTSSILLV